MWRRKITKGAVFLAVAWPGRSLADSHNYINQMRSGAVTHVYFQQSLDGEYGVHQMTGDQPSSDSQESRVVINKNPWKGFGLGSTIGMEVMKFFHFQVGHTFVNWNQADDGAATLGGSRVHAGVRTVFSAPIANLELGAGVQGTRLDYRGRSESTTLYGSGSYASFGLNYFVSTRFSIYGEAKYAQDLLLRSGGVGAVNQLKTEIRMLGLGFRIWL